MNWYEGPRLPGRQAITRLEPFVPSGDHCATIVDRRERVWLSRRLWLIQELENGKLARACEFKNTEFLIAFSITTCNFYPCGYFSQSIWITGLWTFLFFSGLCQNRPFSTRYQSYLVWPNGESPKTCLFVTSCCFQFVSPKNEGTFECILVPLD